MEIGPDKSKVMTNNRNGFQREIKIQGQRLEAVENFKYLGSSISEDTEGLKPEILSKIACENKTKPLRWDGIGDF